MIKGKFSLLAIGALFSVSGCISPETSSGGTYSLVVDHEQHGVMKDEGFTLPACHVRVATLITRVAIPTGKPYSYNGTDSGWGYDDNGRFTIKCVRE